MDERLKKAKSFLKTSGDKKRKVRLRVDSLHSALTAIVEYLVECEGSEEETEV